MFISKRKKPESLDRLILLITADYKTTKGGDNYMYMHSDVERIVYTEQEINNRIAEIGAQITRDYSPENPPLLVGILKGSVVFMSELMKRIELPCDIDFMTIQSYGNAPCSSGNACIKQDLTTDIYKRHVLIIEDILETARTLAKVIEVLKKREPESIKICTLLTKNVEHEGGIKADYNCFDVENEFIVGYGLDYAQQYRNLPYVGVLKPEIYKK